jgi:DNA-binding CsgD family transcriptional regulator
LTSRATAVLAIETSVDPTSAYRATLGRAARRCGFAQAAYMHLGYRLPGAAEVPSRLVSSGSLDETLYLKRGYLAYDPLAARAATAFAPFAWSLEDLADAAARPLARAFEAWGVRSGLVAPIQDSAAGPAFVNFFGSEPRIAPVDPERDALRDGQALLAAAQLHAAARTDLPVQGAADGVLNAREMHVLRLAARGLTEMETAAQLKLSRRGVQFHLSRAGAKLDTPNKTAAVARAIALGLIAM